jgi:hypothetical protein
VPLSGFELLTHMFKLIDRAPIGDSIVLLMLRVAVHMSRTCPSKEFAHLSVLLLFLISSFLSLFVYAFVCLFGAR